jgi:drug/metabolite transporter (DMT)-like permease
MAISFCILGVTGLVMMVGKYVLLPVIGHTLCLAGGFGEVAATSWVRSSS